MSDDTDSVLLSVTPEGVAMVTLNRPHVHNALNADMILKLTDIFDDLEDQDGVRIVLIDGAGRSFSAGADLASMRRAAEFSPSQARDDAGDLALMLLKLRSLPQPTVALVHGAALAGGMGLAAACDIVIATQDASFGLTEVRLGLIPAMISPYIVEAIGARAARRYALTAERLNAAEAQRLGLVHSVVADQNGLAAESERIVSALLQGAPGALASVKELFDVISYMPIDEELADETAAMLAERRASDEAKEGLQAFLDKRKPDWAT